MATKDPPELDEFQKLFAAAVFQSALKTQQADQSARTPVAVQHYGKKDNDNDKDTRDSDVVMTPRAVESTRKSLPTPTGVTKNDKTQTPKSKSKSHPAKPLGVTKPLHKSKKLKLPRPVPVQDEETLPHEISQSPPQLPAKPRRAAAKSPRKPKKPKSIASWDDDSSSIERSESPEQDSAPILQTAKKAADQKKPKARPRFQSPEEIPRAMLSAHQPEQKEKRSRRAQPKVSYKPKKKFILGLDYGTTFTSVSYYTHLVGDTEFTVLPGDIKSIVNWQLSGAEIRQVPTQSWYPLVPRYTAPRNDGELSENESDMERVASKMNWSTEIGTRAHQHVDNDTAETFLWGYEVAYTMYKAGTTRKVDRFIDRPKLMLVRSKHTEADRTKLLPRLSGLIRAGIVKRYGESGRIGMQDLKDVIADFLIRIFQHTKQQLQENEGFTSDSEVEFVMTVPAIWHQGSSRVMQNAIATAIKTTGLGTLSYGSIDNLFVVTEPESAATYLMGFDNELVAGDTIVVLDCGGGPVHAAAFDISSTYPLRLKNEVGIPIRDNCGASHLNDNFENRVLERLADEDYLDIQGLTRETIVKQLVPDFENYDKRYKDITKRPAGSLRIPGLRGDMSRGLEGAESKGFEDNRLILDWRDYDAIFMPILRRVGDLLRTQLEMTFGKDKTVQKVFLIGGFGAAPSLRSYLRKFLDDLVNELNLPYEIELVTTSVQESVSAIASGAILRALNKAGGPIRRAESSYGFLRREPYQPLEIPEHKEQTPEVDALDGHKFVTTIDYFMVKGMVLKPTHKFRPFTCEHAFELYDERLRCEEILYVSDFAKRSHFHPDHLENKGAQISGSIITPMDAFRSPDNVVLPDTDANGEVQGKPHYMVSYDLIPVVEGRNLRYETMLHSGEVRQTGQISIASAFRPGTD
ncbi:hypothetical protein HYALB_00000372 [Hymenoscyphus albidus]|uniref:Actin-like ATPase domain-containing protein n=1 Tax=Hymenoscyphus albidus TaxID=595503 RepID=A0A9N9Q5U0_9HELO|nr:hypothetical protein HYALB_00000372 [Hymenoscyphus albidus]